MLVLHTEKEEPVDIVGDVVKENYASILAKQLINGQTVNNFTIVFQLGCVIPIQPRVEKDLKCVRLHVLVRKKYTIENLNLYNYCAF